MIHPWKTLSSMSVIDDRWLHLTEDRCQLPSGEVIEPYYVVHEGDWVHVFAIDPDDHLVVVQQYRYAGNTVCMELPGGVVDPGEEPLAAAKRELAEETGYTAGSWSYVGSMFANPARQTNRIHVFVARGLSAGMQQLDRTEQLECSLVPVQAVPNAIEVGEFSQALHIASYYRCMQHHRSSGSTIATSNLET